MNKTTPSIEQGGRRLADVRDRQYEAAPDVWNSEARAALTAALDDPHLADRIRDWRLAGCGHVGCCEQTCSPCLRDQLVAHLLGTEAAR